MNDYFWIFVFMLGGCGMAWGIGAKKDYWGWFFIPVFVAMIMMQL